jgi:hypothetical protein
MHTHLLSFGTWKTQQPSAHKMDLRAVSVHVLCLSQINTIMHYKFNTQKDGLAISLFQPIPLLNAYIHYINIRTSSKMNFYCCVIKLICNGKACALSWVSSTLIQQTNNINGIKHKQLHTH